MTLWLTTKNSLGQITYFQQLAAIFRREKK